MKYIFLTFFIVPIISFSQNREFAYSGGTTIITHLTPDTIWIAADSRRTTTVKIGEEFHPLLKIQEYKKYFYTVASSYATISNDTGLVVFDAQELIKQAVDKGGSFDTIVNASGNNITKRLNEIFWHLPQLMRVKMQVLKDKKLFEIVIVSNAKKKISYESMDIMLTLKNKKYEFIKWRLLLDTVPLPYTHVTGMRDNLYEYARSSEYSNKLFTTMEDRLIDLITYEASNNKYVGLPIDVVQIFKNGCKWLTNNEY